MITRTILSICALLILLKTPHAETRTNEKSFTRTLSIDSGYLSSANSNRAIGDFSIDVLKGLGFLYDKGNELFSPESIATRATYNIGFWLITFPISAATLVNFHEFGHARSLKSLGFESTYHIPPYKCNNWFSFWSTSIFSGYFENPFQSSHSYVLPDYTLSNPGLTRFNSIKQYVSEDMVTEFAKHYKVGTEIDSRRQQDPAFKAAWSAAAKLPNLDDQYKLIEPYLSTSELDSVKYLDEAWKNNKHPLLPKAQVIMYASGLNNNVSMTQRVEDDIWFHQGQHHQITSNYAFDKLSIFFQTVYMSVMYGKNDKPSDHADYQCILNTWKNHFQLDYSECDLQLYSVLSYFLSSQSYMNMYQMYKTLETGSNIVLPAEINGFRIPNIGLYLTTLGPTYNIRSGYRFQYDLFLICSIEFLLNKNQKQIDSTLGVRKQFPQLGNMYIHAETTFNSKAIGGTFFLGGEITNTLMWESGVTVHNANTFLGERNIPSLLNGDIDFELWLKLGVAY